MKYFALFFLLLFLTIRETPAQQVHSQVVVEGLKEPVFISADPTNSQSILVVERRGRIRRIENGALKRGAYLDIEDKVRSKNSVGLVSLAFPENFSATKKFFLLFTDTQGDMVLGRITLSEDGTPDEDSLLILLKVVQPYQAPGAPVKPFKAAMTFGESGFLYIAFGDGGSPRDANQYSQNLSSLLGKVIRIDVSNDTYSVPKDNPYRNNNNHMPEIWSSGIQSPSRLYFDSASQNLFLTDQGSHGVQEVNLIKRGESYGWSDYEGERCLQTKCTSQQSAPLKSYLKEDGTCIVGGVFYRGRKLNQLLHDTFIFADCTSGALWGLSPSETAWNRLVVGSLPKGITSFGVDSEKEIFFTTTDGKLLRLLQS